jgi:hypothetical protein
MHGAEAERFHAAMRHFRWQADCTNVHGVETGRSGKSKWNQHDPSTTRNLVATLARMSKPFLSAFAFCPIALFFVAWGMGFLASGDLDNASGFVAQRRLASFWPDGLDAALHSDCSIRTRLTAESQETLIGMSCGVDAADAWKAHLSSAFHSKLRELDEDEHGIVEVRVSESPSHPIFETKADWWHPSGDEFVSHQTMAWFKTLRQPVSRAYSFQYDRSQKRLWISLIVQCKDSLWNRGEGILLSESEFGRSHYLPAAQTIP